MPAKRLAVSKTDLDLQRFARQHPEATLDRSWSRDDASIARLSAVISCPSCNEAKRLQGERAGEEIVVTCLNCGHVWRRHPDDCPRYRQRTLEPVRVALMQKARGTQQSIVAYRMAKECSSCGFTSEQPN